MSESENILLVEDSPTQSEAVRAILEDAGYRVRVVSNGEDALEALQAGPSQVVLSDILMPGMDGYALCRRIKDNEATWDTPVILLTSLSDPEDVVRGLACGADNFIMKPYEPAYLLSRVQSVLTNRVLRSGDEARMGLEIFFGGKKHYINSDRLQILNLLISTYDNAIRVNQRLAASQAQLETLNGKLETLVRERTRALTAEVEEHHATMDALRRSEEYYHALLDNDLTGVVVMSPQGAITDCNSAFLRTFRFANREEACGHTMSELCWEAADKPEYLRQMTQNRVGEFRERTFRRSDGEKIFALESGMERRAATGEAVQVVSYIMDVTDRRKLEASYLQAQKMEAIGQLAGGIAHDFNNMLMVILGFTDVLSQKDAADEGQQRYLREIRKATMRAAGLTQQLLAFSRKQVLQLETLCLNGVIEDTAKMITRLIGEDISLHLMLGSVSSVRADRGQIGQILMNLAVNARDAMPQGGSLEVETSERVLTEADARERSYVRPGPYVRLTVRDTGVGMDAATQAHLFEPFFTTKGGKGTGLGLATVYGIVKQTGGYIWCESARGKGSAFTIHFPTVTEPAAPGAGEAETPQLLAGTETILLAEDEQMLADVLAETLAQAGYTVIRASSGREALERCRAHERVDLVLSDVVMPEMRGPEMARRIRDALPDIKIIMMSGYPDLGDTSHVLPGPGDVFLQKPVSAQKLLTTVRQVLDRERSDASKKGEVRR